MGGDDERAYDLQIYDGIGSYCGVRVGASWTTEILKKSLEIRLAVSVSEQRIYLGLDELPNDAVLGPRLEPHVPAIDSGKFFLTKRSHEQATWLEKIKKNPLAFNDKAPNAARIDKDSALIGVGLRGNGLNYRFVEGDLRYDKEVVLAALSEDPNALQYVPERLRWDHEVVLAAVRKDGEVLKYALKRVRGDRVLAMAAVRSNGWALHWCEPELQQDREVVLAAVASRGRALCYAHEALQGDFDVALAAVRQDGLALELVSSEMRANCDVVLAAALQNADALHFAAPELRTHYLLVEAAGHAGVCKRLPRNITWEQLCARQRAAEEAAEAHEAKERELQEIAEAEVVFER